MYSIACDTLPHIPILDHFTNSEHLVLLRLLSQVPGPAQLFIPDITEILNRLDYNSSFGVWNSEVVPLDGNSSSIHQFGIRKPESLLFGVNTRSRIVSLFLFPRLQCPMRLLILFLRLGMFFIMSPLRKQQVLSTLWETCFDPEFESGVLSVLG